jgi:hypothetical protein
MFDPPCVFLVSQGIVTSTRSANNALSVLQHDLGTAVSCDSTQCSGLTLCPSSAETARREREDVSHELALMKAKYLEFKSRALVLEVSVAWGIALVEEASCLHRRAGGS